MSKKSLAVALSRLRTFDTPNPMLEQYSTDSEIASDMLWHAFMSENVKDKVVADLGSGTGILGIGCLLLGARHVYFVEKDASAVAILKKNLEGLQDFSILESDIKEFSKNVDTVIMNPPFGTRNKGADIDFIRQASLVTGHIYTLHKTITLKYLQEKVGKQGLQVLERIDYAYPLKKTMAGHSKRVQRIEVSCLVLHRKTFK